jgi:Fe2+ or Zn2+ uptake regulation protein
MSPESAKYCMECGFSLEQKAGNIIEDDDTMEDENGFDLETRILCPDGTCTGILAMGRCTECGKAFPQDDNSNNI